MYILSIDNNLAFFGNLTDVNKKAIYKIIIKCPYTQKYMK